MRERSRFGALGLLVGFGMCLVLATVAGAGHVAGDDRTASPADNQKPNLESIRGAVVRALPLLVKASALEYPKHRDCFSCHNQAVPAVALSLARQRGFDVEAQTLRAIAKHTESDLNGALEAYRKGQGQPGGVIRAGYALWTLQAAGWLPDETTAGVALYLTKMQDDRDRWPPTANRPPSESSSFTAAALALRGLQAFGPSATAAAQNNVPLAEKSRSGTNTADAQRVRALHWLEQTKPKDTEDRVFRLWGLKHAGASASSIAAAADDLVQAQSPDGGWSQLDTPAGPPKTKDGQGKTNTAVTSDAYATGSALVALQLAGGISTDVPAYRRGLAFLIQSQRDDGTWLIKSRSRPFQTYFESGFPHGPNQFISTAGSGWATAALVLACPPP